MTEILVPFPPSELNPNRRLHWAAKARHTKAYRNLCGMHALEAGARRGQYERVRVTITFYPPDKRPRDRDNMIAAFKAGQDGIADVTGIDDANWITSYAFEAPQPGGGVSVKLEESE
jgi:crossover junction endodeoxyribonuclease RusA